MVKKYILMISLISSGLNYSLNATNQPSQESFKTNAPTLLQSIQSKITYTKTEFAKLDLEWQRLIKMRIGLNCARLGLFGFIFYQIHTLNKQLDKIVEKRERSDKALSEEMEEYSPCQLLIEPFGSNFIEKKPEEVEEYEQGPCQVWTIKPFESKLGKKSEETQPSCQLRKEQLMKKYQEARIKEAQWRSENKRKFD